MSGSFSDGFFASPTTPDEIINIVSSLKSSNSEGVDGINVNVIKASIDVLASPLSQMCNISFSTGIVPDKLKISKVLQYPYSKVKIAQTSLIIGLSQSYLASLKSLRVPCTVV